MKSIIKIRSIALIPAFMMIILFLVLMTGSAHAFGSVSEIVAVLAEG